MSLLIHNDCLSALKEMPENSVDSIVTDPPYGLSFMGKKWDYDVPSVEIWKECLRVLKPGGHLLSFAGTRTQHRMAINIEDAGFEIRDMIAWVYGSGFPKSLDVSKAIDKAAGAEREVVGKSPYSANRKTAKGSTTFIGQDEPARMITKPATDDAQKWQGWGTALKPALEPITLARKPFKATVAANVLEHGTGAINVDGCRVGDNAGWSYPKGRGGTAWHGRDSLANNLTEPMAATQGRWPANFIHDGSDEAVTLLGEPARFFYCAKASKKDRNEGCEKLSAENATQRMNASSARMENGAATGKREPQSQNQNHHPTVKPTALMRYLVRLVTPPDGTVLDPFMGSGSTGKAAKIEGFNFIGIEREAEYIDIAKERIESAQPQML